MTKKEFLEILKKNNISINEFAKLSNMPLGTCYGWDGEKKPFPNWVASWLDNYEKKQEYENIIKNNAIAKLRYITKEDKQD